MKCGSFTLAAVDVQAARVVRAWLDLTGRNVPAAVHQGSKASGVSWSMDHPAIGASAGHIGQTKREAFRHLETVAETLEAAARAVRP